MSATPFTVAIDGPAAAGKGTVSRAVAARFGLAHLDTGLLYRAVGAEMLMGVDPIEAARSLDVQALEQEHLRTADVAQAASKVALIGDVRDALLDFQRAFARRAGGAVLDGRDIGTVICPQAEVKLFVTASPDARAARRHAELVANGADVDLATVVADVRVRDARDADRAVAPMQAADGAILIDTSDMTIDEAVDTAVGAVEEARATLGLPTTKAPDP